MNPRNFRSLIREGKWRSRTGGVCQGYAQSNLVILPKEYAFEFLLFCNRNPRPCPVLDVTEPGDPHPKLVAPDADLRTDLPKYRIFQDGRLVDEPSDIIEYWKDNLVGFLLGCSFSFEWALTAANIPWRIYSIYRTTIPCIPAGRFHGPMVVTPYAFMNSHDAVRAVQISSRHLLMHGSPVHIGDPATIGIENLGEPDPFFPTRPFVEPPKPGEVVMYWGCGATPQSVALESKVPFVITHCPGYMFVTDRLAEELAIL
jgi:uncharacterized protein YcsI (UPF0317 family)